MSSKPPYKAPTQRQLRVGETLRHGLAQIFTEEVIHDPELGKTSITVSEVRVSPDLRTCTAFVMPLGGVADSKAFLAALKRLSPMLRAQLAKRVNLRYAPELLFRVDDSFNQATKIETLLKAVLSDESAKELEPADE